MANRILNAEGVFDLVEKTALVRLLGHLVTQRRSQLLEDRALFITQLAWHEHLHRHNLVTSIPASHVRYPFLPQAKLLARLCTVRQSKRDRTVDSVDLDLIAERRLSDIDANL